MPALRQVARAMLILALLGSGFAAAAEFQWRDVRQEVWIQADGTVLVSDERTLVATDGDFGEAFIEIELDPGQILTLLEGEALDPGPGWRAFQQSTQRGQEVVIRNDRRITTRRVRFLYRLEAVLDPRSDVVQFYWQVLETERPVVIGYDLVVHAPGPMRAPYDAFVHTLGNPERPEVTLTAGRDRLTVVHNRVPAGNGVEIRYLLDPALFEQAGTRAGLQEFLEDEVRVAGLDERAAALARLRSHPGWGWLGLFLVGLYLVRIVSKWNRFGREPEIAMRFNYLFEPPSDSPPAAVSAMTSQLGWTSQMPNGFFATVMDLARQGFGSFETRGKEFEMTLDLDRDAAGLQPFESAVLGYLRQAAASGGDPASLTSKELKSYAGKTLSSFMSGWSPRVRAWAEKRLGGPLLDPESQAAALRWSIAGGVLSLALLFGGVFLADGIALALLTLSSLLAIGVTVTAALTLPRWSRAAAKEVYGWHAFRRALSDFTQMRNAPDDFFVLWDRYYCYAAALGVAQRFLANLRRVAPLRNLSEGDLVARGSWLGVTSLRAGGFAAASATIAALSSAVSSVSASSGGSSSGGGGGGGGGRSGGR
jgi:hypothetical protein